MSRLVHKQSQFAGLPPGAVLAGAAAGAGRLVLTSYSADDVEVREIGDAAELAERRDDRVRWLHVVGPWNEQLIHACAAHFGLHALALEAVLNPGQRPRAEEFGEHVVVTLRELRCESGGTESSNVGVVIGERLVITFVAEATDVLQPVAERLQVIEARMRTRGADYLAYRALDAVVDRYYALIENVGETIDAVGRDVMLSHVGSDQLKQLHHAKLDLLVMRKAISPLRDVLQRLDRLDTELIREETRPFLRDVQDHVTQVNDTLTLLRENVLVLVDLHLNMTSHRMNEIMKVLTIISTIFIPLSFLAGLYGMNFANMPELQTAYGYPALLAVMAVLGGGMLVYFRRRGWL